MNATKSLLTIIVVLCLVSCSTQYCGRVIDEKGIPVSNAKVATFSYPMFSVSPIGIYPVSEEHVLSYSNDKGEFCFRSNSLKKKSIRISKGSLAGGIDLNDVKNSQFKVVLKEKKKPHKNFQISGNH